MKKKVFLIPLAALGFLLNVSLTFADAPVEDLTSPDSQDSAMTQATPQAGQAANSMSDAQPISTDGQSDNGRLSRLETQVSNMTSMNMPQQIEQLRQQVQELNGRLQVQQHDIELLKNEQKEFYKDLNNRMKTMKSGSVSADTATSGATAAAATSGSKTNKSDSAAYRAAFNLLMKRKYDDAMTAFQDYLSNHPKGKYVSNAYYWMGELYLKRKDTEMASKSFNRIITQYPDSNKVPDAKLKLAIIHMGEGKKSQAKKELQTIKQQYPNSTAAQLASIQLQRMTQ